MELRNYQQVCVEKIKEDIGDGQNALCVLPTGSGKTWVLASVVKNLGGSYLILVNKAILIRQITSSLIKFDVEPTIFSASLNTKEISKVTVATIQSIAKLKELQKFDHIIVDEAHRFDFEYGQISNIIGDTKIIGFTATPFTANGPIYGEEKIFTHKTYVKTVREMTEEGYLVPLMYRSTNKEAELNFSGIKKRKDDYVLKELQDFFISNEDKIKLQIKDALSKSQGYKKILVVTTGIEHAEIVHSMLEDSSIVHSKQTREDRDKNFVNFTNGNNRFLVSVLIASEGFDYPPAEVLWLMRPTRSPVLYMQAAGRVLRTSPGKTHALLLDYGNVVPTLGSIYDINEGPAKERLKLCPHCETYNKSDAKKCYKCQQDFMQMCYTCMKMHKYGEKCAISPKKERNPYKNLTITASEDTWEPITTVRVFNHRSKKGNMLPRADYYNGWRLVVSEYFFNIGIDIARQIVAGTKEVKIGRNKNGYRTVVGRRR